MREWYKYSLESNQQSMLDIPPGGVCSTKEDYFRKYLYGCCDRLLHYDHFIRGHLGKHEEALSIGSGRCANELYLSEDGYDIVCSDLKHIIPLDLIVPLFPHFHHKALNILTEASGYKYDVVICLSVIYQFNDKQLFAFFRNVRASLQPSGYLILDGASSPNNLLSYFIHDLLLKYETYLYWLGKLVIKRKNDKVTKIHHGYRRTDAELVTLAQVAGFRLLDKKDYAFYTEFERSRLLRKLSILKGLFAIMGRRIPYVRMFYFKVGLG